MMATWGLESVTKGGRSYNRLAVAKCHTRGNGRSIPRKNPAKCAALPPGGPDRAACREGDGGTPWRMAVRPGGASGILRGILRGFGGTF